MSWTEGIAANVCAELEEEFQWWQQIHGHDVLELQLSTVAKPLQGLDSRTGAVRVLASPAKASANRPRRLAFRVVVLATGFSPERYPEGHDPGDWKGYWETDALKVDPRRPLLIAGLGDGGLADLIRAYGIEDASIRSALESVSIGLGPRRLHELEAFERNAAALRSVHPDMDLSPIITKRYQEALTNVRLDAPATLPVRTYLVGSGRHVAPFRDGTYPGNRAIAIALINGLKPPRKWEFVPGPVDLTRPFDQSGCPPIAYATFPQLGRGVRRSSFVCNAVMRNGPGPAPIERVLDPKAVEHLRKRLALFDLALTERPLFPSPLRALVTQGGLRRRLPRLPQTRRLRVYSEFYDSYIQRNLANAVTHETARAVLLGRLRLQALLFDVVQLTDAMVLDGACFADLVLSDPAALADLVPRLQLRSRAETLDRALLAFLGANGDKPPQSINAVPEISIAPAAVRTELREDLFAALVSVRTWPPKKFEELARLLTPRHPAWTRVIRRWEAVLRGFGQAPTSVWKRRIVSPTPLTNPPNDSDKEIVRTIARRFREPRSVVFAGLETPADELLHRPLTARVVEWYNSAYNEAIAIRHQASVFDGFWLPEAVVKGGAHDAEETQPFSYHAIGLCETGSWKELAAQVALQVGRWRAGDDSLDAIIEAVNRGIGGSPTTVAGSTVTFGKRLEAYGGAVQLREAAFALQGGPGVRNVRCLLDWHPVEQRPLAVTRLLGGV
jgi:hypothetical protein